MCNSYRVFCLRTVKACNSVRMKFIYMQHLSSKFVRYLKREAINVCCPKKMQTIRMRQWKRLMNTAYFPLLFDHLSLKYSLWTYCLPSPLCPHYTQISASFSPFSPRNKKRKKRPESNSKKICPNPSIFVEKRVCEMWNGRDFSEKYMREGEQIEMNANQIKCKQIAIKLIKIY